MTRTHPHPTRSTATRAAACLACALLASASALAQEAATSDAERLDRLEQENAELRRRIDVVAGEVERFSLGQLLAPEIGASAYGFGPAASKIYAVESGLSIGGYGEFKYQDPQGGSTDQFDALRAVLYFGYKFDEHWVFNSEIEFEHATTGTNPDGESGEVSVEFAYLDWLATEDFGVRGGLLLVPMGFLNELHEPTTYLSASRTRTETVILPSTWRETGLGVFGEAGGFDWRSYVVAGLEGKEFSAGGLRDGRQKGNRSDAEDVAWVTRADWTATPGLVAGGSFYWGDSGQDVGPDVGTAIWEVHAEWERRGFHARALAALAELDDVSELNAVASGGPLVGADSIGEELAGWYAEVGYDLMSWLAPSSGQSLTPFLRYEAVDTQAEVPSGFASDPDNDVEIVTLGVAYQPIDHVILKLDYEDWDDRDGGALDRWNFAIGYIF
jgi:hypothetical protein